MTVTRQPSLRSDAPSSHPRRLEDPAARSVRQDHQPGKLAALAETRPMSQDLTNTMTDILLPALRHSHMTCKVHHVLVGTWPPASCTDAMINPRTRTSRLNDYQDKRRYQVSSRPISSHSNRGDKAVQAQAWSNDKRRGPRNRAPWTAPHGRSLLVWRLAYGSVRLGIEACRSGQRGKQGCGFFDRRNELARRVADLLRAVVASHLGKPALDRDRL